MELDIDTFNRLSLSIMEKSHCGPEEALQQLASLSLHLECGETIRSSLPLQAALLTAVNTGKRAFLGGISVDLPLEVATLLPWPGKKTLNEIVTELGGSFSSKGEGASFGLTFGLAASIDNNRLQVICNDWQAGILNDNALSHFDLAGTVPTAGIFAGGLGVCFAFLKCSGIQMAVADQSVGLSLWRPDLPWLDEQAVGPAVTLLPKRFWLLGLGHLGQAYLWNIGLLPFLDPSEATILLQDDDKMTPANWSAGLLTRNNEKREQKTRLCSRWLERRGFTTLITERRFDEFTHRINEEPYLALCGFDSLDSRLPLEKAGFDLILEAGLGGNLASFDRISLHTFPGAAQTPEQIWQPSESHGQEINPAIYELVKDLTDDICGILPMTLAGKAISASFVGACTGALIVVESIRGLHGGIRYDKITLQLRDLFGIRSIPNQLGKYGVELSRNGFIYAS